MTVSQHVQYQGLETEAAKWNLTIIHFIIYTSVFSHSWHVKLYPVKRPTASFLEAACLRNAHFVMQAFC